MAASDKVASYSKQVGTEPSPGFITSRAFRKEQKRFLGHILRLMKITEAPPCKSENPRSPTLVENFHCLLVSLGKLEHQVIVIHDGASPFLNGPYKAKRITGPFPDRVERVFSCLPQARTINIIF